MDEDGTSLKRAPGLPRIDRCSGGTMECRYVATRHLGGEAPATCGANARPGAVCRTLTAITISDPVAIPPAQSDGNPASHGTGTR